MAKALEFLAAWKGRLVAAFFMVAAGAVLGGALAWWLQGNRYERQLFERGRELAELRAEQARQVAEAVNAARFEEQRRTAAQTEITNGAIQQAEAARADARAADTARRELLARATALANASRGPGDPAAVGCGAPAAAPVDLLADLLGRADARAGELAEYADAARIAGEACQLSYEALSSSPQ